MCFSLSYYKILYAVVHVRKSDHAVNTNFPLPPPFQRSVVWEGKGREGAGANKFSQRMKGGGPAWGEGAGGKINVRIDPPPPPWVVLSTIWNVLSEKQKLKIDCNF